MTADELMAMHRATENVVEAMSQIADDDPGTTGTIAASVRDLAVVQRDLLKALLGG